MRRRLLLVSLLALAVTFTVGCGDDATWILAVDVNGGDLSIHHPADADSLAGPGETPGGIRADFPQAEDTRR